MRERYLAGRFGNCPRVMCEKQNVLPIAISEDMKIARVKVYCPRCKDVYSPKKKSADADGAYFGTSFPHLLLMVQSPQIDLSRSQTILQTRRVRPKSLRFQAGRQRGRGDEGGKQALSSERAEVGRH
jgi:hypothetical protein